MDRARTPVVLVIFNRPDLTQITFREIARARPHKLLVVADGPRPDRRGEGEKCVAARKVIEQVDWDCEVLTNFSDVNLGCKRRVSSGISWAFEQVEEAIILEDDCVPDPSFFQFCDELLGRYRDDGRVMSIAGTCFLGDVAGQVQSYYFSRIPFVWGWATWRRAWRKYDVEAKSWPRLRKSREFSEMLPDWSVRRHYRGQFDRTYRGKLDTWDSQWMVALCESSGVAITPTRNLITNIGFGTDATHTLYADAAMCPPREPMSFPLVHPKSLTVDQRADMNWARRQYSFGAKVRRRLSSMTFRRLARPRETLK